MSFIKADSFDHYTTATAAGKWSAVSTSFGGGVASGIGAQGTKGWKLSVNDYLLETVTSHATFIVSFHFVLTGITGGRIFSAYDDTTLQWYLANLSNTNKLALYKGDGTLLAELTLGLPTLVRHWASLKVTISNTVGTINLNLNNVVMPEFTKTLQDTQMSANASANVLKFERPSTGSDVWLDNVILYNGAGSVCNDLLNETHLWTLDVDGDGAVQNGTPSSGVSHYVLVNETVPDGDSTYMALTAAAQRELFTFENLSVTGTIPFVCLETYLAKTDAGDTRNQGVFRVGSTNYDQTEKTVSTTYQWQSDPKELNPNGDIAWVNASVDALQAGTLRSA